MSESRLLAGAPDVMKPEEAAKWLRIGRNKVYELIREGRLRAATLGHGFRVTRNACLEFLGEGAGA